MSTVNHPKHYNMGKIEVLDFILDKKFNYLAGSIVKYMSRYRWKGSPLEDLKKARFYLDRLIEQVEADPCDQSDPHPRHRRIPQ